MANWKTDGNSPGAGEFLGTNNAQPLIVHTNGTERLRVRSDGRLGVGLTDPRTQLHVLERLATGLDHTSAGAITFFHRTVSPGSTSTTARRVGVPPAGCGSHTATPRALTS